MNAPACPKHDTGAGPCYCNGSMPDHDHKLAVLTKAALDAASELDGLQAEIYTTGSALVDLDRHQRLRSVVERVYAAAEDLGVVVGAPEESIAPEFEQVAA